MKSLGFSLSILVFAVLLCGCGGGGGGGGGGVPVTPAQNVTFEALVPSSTLSANIVENSSISLRADLQPEDIEIFLEGVPLKYITRSGDSLIYRLNFDAQNASFTKLIEQGGGIVELMIAVGTKEAVRLQLQLNTRTDGSSTKKLMVTMRITNNIRNGTYGVEIFGGPGVGPIGAPGQSNKSLGITDIEYLNDSQEYLPLADATDVPLDNTTFKITFDAVVTNATNSFRIMATSESGTSVILTHEDIGSLLSVKQKNFAETTTDPAYSHLIISLLKNNKDGKFLHPNTTYTLIFKSASISRQDTPYVKLRPFSQIQRSFTTASTD